MILSLYSTTTGKRVRLLGRLGPGGWHMAELSVTPDAARRHLLIYGYFAFHQMAEMNLSTGHLISVTTTQPPVLDGAQTSAAW